jgi:hypothetical protein
VPGYQQAAVSGLVQIAGLIINAGARAGAGAASSANASCVEMHWAAITALGG